MKMLLNPHMMASARLRGIFLVWLLVVLACVRADDKRTNAICDHNKEEECWSRSGEVCNGVGECKCGTCVCETGYSGPTCEDCPTCVSPCERFKNCVECKAFGTGNYGVMECIQKCDNDATYIPVDEFSKEEEKYLCKFRNSESCTFSFRVGDAVDGFWNIDVKTSVDCPTYEPEPEPTSTSIEVAPVVGSDTPADDDKTATYTDISTGGEEQDDGSARTGGLESEDSTSPTGGCSALRFSVIALVSPLFVLLFVLRRL